MRWGLFILLVMLLAACKEKLEIVNFSQIDPIKQSVSFNMKSTLVPTLDRGYLLGGTTQEGEIFIAKLSEQGNVQSITRHGSGVAHGIHPYSGTGEMRYLVVCEKEKSPFVMEMNSDGELLKEVDLKAYFDEQIGLVDYVKAYDICMDQSGSFVLTGMLKQIGAPERLFLGSLSPGLDKVNWIRTYTTNSVGHSIAVDSISNYVVGGYGENGLALFKMNQEGILQWNKTLFGQGVRDRLTADVHLKNDNTYFLNGWMLLNGDTSVVNTFANNGQQIVGIRDTLGIPVIEGHTMVKTKDGGTVIAGVDEGEEENLVLYYLPPEGGEAWAVNPRRYQIPGLVLISDLVQTADEGLAILSLSLNESAYAYHLLKTDKVGDRE